MKSGEPHLSFIQRGGLWVAAQHALTVAALALAPLFPEPWRSTATTLAGLALFVAGGSFGISGARALGRNRTPYPQPLEDSKLVRRGIYSVARHPLYASLMFASAGWALVWGSGAALAASAALTVLLRAKAIREERWLRARYPEYREYEQRVKRFVPGIW
jgi:protein-S-isoprenylcysteine O-methyltransferase Ste14